MTALPEGNPPPIDLDRADLYLNRELSWLAFNSRVLEEASNPTTPLLEQLKFLGIYSSNLDEMFMVRVAGLKKLLEEDIPRSDSPDNMTTTEVLKEIHRRTGETVRLQYKHYRDVVLPGLTEAGVRIAKIAELGPDERKRLADYFTDQVFPVLTPLAIDASHPFPFLSNLSIYLVVTLSDEQSPQDGVPLIGLVEVPSVLPRLVPVQQSENLYVYVMLEDLIAENLSNLFLGFHIRASFPVRVTRNLDYTLLESEVVDLLKAIQKEVINREHNEAVRLEVSAQLPAPLLHSFMIALGLSHEDVYRVDGPLVLSGLRTLCDLPFPQHKDPPFNPRLPQRMAGNEDIFALISEGDLFLHHPYESFYAVIELLNSAAQDPHVLAIKQTLYRTSGDSPIIDALIAAAENGKQVTAVVELKARFDEKNNIVWARRLERAGVNVVFGFIGLKTHCKATLIVRKEINRIARYVHLSTGNYNSTTAKLYTDLGFFTADVSIGNEVAALFNLLTGFNVLTGDAKLRRKEAFPKFTRLAVSPLNLRSTVASLVDREIEICKKGGKGLIIAKMNALLDREIIRKLYEGSVAGVEIRLIIRGICCLRPGVPGVSENIKVISIVDRFLEHSRVFYFAAGGLDEVYASSADWMPRNMDRRIEIFFPILDNQIKRRLIDQVLGISWSDNVKARELRADGTYRLRAAHGSEKHVRSQQKFIDIAREGGIQSIPYEQAIRHNPARKRGARPVAKKSAPATSKKTP